MKKLALLTAFALTSYLGISQDTTITSNDMTTIKSGSDFEPKTLFGNSSSLGLYGAFTMQLANIEKQDALILGGRVAFVLDHALELGFAGYGLVTSVEVNQDDTISVNGGYGGIHIEPVLGSKLPVHISFPTLIGVGGAGTFKKVDDIFDINDINNHRDGDAFLILEPGATVEFNLTKHVRLSTGASYRYLYGLNLEDVEKDALNGLSARFTLKIGSF